MNSAESVRRHPKLYVADFHHGFRDAVSGGDVHIYRHGCATTLVGRNKIDIKGSAEISLDHLSDFIQSQRGVPFYKIPHSSIGDSTRNDLVEVPQIDMNVHTKPVQGDPPR